MKDTNSKAMTKRLRCESIVSVLWYQMVRAGRDRHHQGHLPPLPDAAWTPYPAYEWRENL
nr:hypothetical protein [Escherichia coli]